MVKRGQNSSLPFIIKCYRNPECAPSQAHLATLGQCREVHSTSQVYYIKLKPLILLPSPHVSPKHKRVLKNLLFCSENSSEYTNFGIQSVEGMQRTMYLTKRFGERRASRRRDKTREYWMRSPAAPCGSPWKP